MAKKKKALKKAKRALPAKKAKKATTAMVVARPPQRELAWKLSEEEVTILKNSIAKGASDAELQFCLTVARRYKLDPFKQQIWFIKRWNSDADDGKGGKGAHVWVPQVGIYGMMHTAARDHKDYGSVSLPEYGADITIDVEGVKVKGPAWARVKVWRKGATEPSVGEAYFDEYCPKRKSNLTFWKIMPHRMIAKCAKAQAIRECYPDLGGLYIPEEMARTGDDYSEEGRQIVQADGTAPSGRQIDYVHQKRGEAPQLTPEQQEIANTKLSEFQQREREQMEQINREKTIDINPVSVSPSPSLTAPTVPGRQTDVPAAQTPPSARPSQSPSPAVSLVPNRAVGTIKFAQPDVSPNTKAKNVRVNVSGVTYSVFNSHLWAFFGDTVGLEGEFGLNESKQKIIQIFRIGNRQFEDNLPVVSMTEDRVSSNSYKREFFTNA